MALTQEQVETIAAAAAAEVALSREEIAAIVEAAVKQTLIQLGVDSSNPIEMQRDFQHLRQWRRTGEDLRSKGMLALMGIFVTGAVSLLIVGLKDYFAR